MYVKELRQKVLGIVHKHPPRDGMCGLGSVLGLLPVEALDKMGDMEEASGENRCNNWLAAVLDRSEMYSRDGEYVERNAQRR